jgi:AraC-like DNA-binding protein
LSGAVLVGAHCEPMVIDSEEQKHVFGIQFRSGAAHAFFRPPLHEFANAHVEIDDLWCGAELRIRLLECVGDTEAIFDLAERLLAAQWIEQRCVHPAVRYAVREMARSSRPVIELVDATGLSSRRFIQLFKEQVGLTPKVFGRLQRFQRALRLADETGSAVDWSLVALNCGYYDQSHLCRDFREFAGISPELYRCTANKNQNHVPIE